MREAQRLLSLAKSNLSLIARHVVGASLPFLVWPASLLLSLSHRFLSQDSNFLLSLSLYILHSSQRSNVDHFPHTLPSRPDPRILLKKTRPEPPQIVICQLVGPSLRVVLRSGLHVINSSSQNPNAGPDPEPEPASEVERPRSRFSLGCFTEEKAKQLRKKTLEGSTFHDAMYHSAIASRLATDLSDRANRSELG